jgi:hypothetical protein
MFSKEDEAWRQRFGEGFVDDEPSEVDELDEDRLTRMEAEFFAADEARTSPFGQLDELDDLEDAQQN